MRRDAVCIFGVIIILDSRPGLISIPKSLMRGVSVGLCKRILKPELLVDEQ